MRPTKPLWADKENLPLKNSSIKQYIYRLKNEMRILKSRVWQLEKIQEDKK